MNQDEPKPQDQPTPGPDANTAQPITGEPKTSPTQTGQSSKPSLRVRRFVATPLPKDHPFRKGYLLLQPLTKSSSTNTPTKLSAEGKNLPPPVDPSPDKPQ